MFWKRLVKIPKKKISEGFLDIDQNKKILLWCHLCFIMNFGYSMVNRNFAKIAFRKNWPYKIASGLISDMLQWLTSFPKIFIFHPVSPTIIGRHLGLFFGKIWILQGKPTSGSLGHKNALNDSVKIEPKYNPAKLTHFRLFKVKFLKIR